MEKSNGIYEKPVSIVEEGLKPLDELVPRVVQRIELLEMQLEEAQTKAKAYDRLIEKLSLWGKHLKSASMTQNSLDFIYCAQQVMDEITLTLPDGWEEK